MSAPVRWSASWDLAARAWAWSLVTVPAVAALGMAGALVANGIDPGIGGLTLGDVVSTSGWFVMVLGFLDILSVFLAFGAALVALPFTHLLEVVLRHVPGVRTRALLHACLAGVLACVPAAFGSDAFSLAWLAPLAVAAGTSAALAVRGADRRRRLDGLEARLGPAADATGPGREIPTGPAPSLQTGELP